jgi:signal transduction histidine kinase
LTPGSAEARTFLRRHWGDILVVVAFLAAVAELAWHIPWGESDDTLDLDRASRWLAIPFVALWTLPLLLRRRSGLVAGLAVFIAIATLAAIDSDATDSVVLFVTILAASAAIGLHEDRRRAVAGGLIALACLLVLIGVSNGGLAGSDIFVGIIFALGPLAGGQVVRSITQRNALLEARTRELERLQIEQAEAAVIEERTRIADELHDVIAQGVSVMTVQASGARLLLRTDPARAREAILAVEETGREALTETRRLLGILRRDSTAPQLSPQPGVTSLQNLIDREIAGGIPVTLRIEGDPRALPAGVDVTAYRVVDEALANVREHRGVTHAAVTLRWAAEALVLEIADDGRPAGHEPGLQLVALSERLRVHGGSVELSPSADGMCLVNARIPLEARE